MPKIELKNINKIYPNGFQAVYDFNLEINEGEFIVLVGPSGCGKSTTLRMIAGLEDITKGEFFIGDKLANQLGPKARGIAMVFQSYALYPHLSVFENIAFGLNLQGLDEDVIEERVNKTAAILGLTDYLDRKPKALSGGQRQRVALGRAIIRHVDIFLMDEPLSNLDAKQRVTTRAEIIDIHRKVGATTIYVTHDQTEAMTMADRIVVMNKGYVQQIGTPKELYFHPYNSFVAGFIGEPPMNLLNAEFKGDDLHLSDSIVLKGIVSHFGLENANPEIIFGFRPEHVELIMEEEKETDDYYYFDGEVELTELLGDNGNVYVKLDHHNVILKAEPLDLVKLEDRCKFKVHKRSLYFFDRKTGKNLRF